MSASRYFKAPWSGLLIVMSIIGTVLCVGLAFVPQLRIFPLAPLGFKSLLMLFVVLTPLACLFFSVTGYTVEGRELLIHRLGWKTRISLADLQGAEANARAMDGSIRLFGNGGLFSFTGWYSNTQLGKFRAFVTDFRRSVVLTFPKRRIVVSPEQPDEFAKVVEGELGL